MTSNRPDPEEIVAFWREAGRERWFASDPDFDRACTRFRDAVEAAAAGLLEDWGEHPRPALALVLLLDQFPRNLFRGTVRAYAADGPALATARRAIASGHDLATDGRLRSFFYVPFTHAEDEAAQLEGIAAYETADDAAGLRWARHHRGIIRRFGRFPHRNRILGRASTPEEDAYLAADGFRG